MPRVVHFEIPCVEPERAAEFYRKVFDWKIEKWAGPMEYWMVTTGANGPGIDGGLMKRPGPVTTTVDVESLDAAIEAVKKAGGKLLVDRTAIPTIGYMAQCADTEGNFFGLMQVDPNAK